MRPEIRILGMAAILLVSGCATPDEPPQLLAATMIHERLGGHSFMGVAGDGQRFYLTLRPNLVFDYVGADAEFGTWTTEGDNLCLVFHGEAPRCAPIVETGPARFMLGDTAVEYWSPQGTDPPPGGGRGVPGADRRAPRQLL